jgi:hypothetical protein
MATKKSRFVRVEAAFVIAMPAGCFTNKKAHQKGGQPVI